VRKVARPTSLQARGRFGPAFVGLLVAVALSQACGSGNKVSGCAPGPDLCASYCAHVFSTPCEWPPGAAITCVSECHAAAASLVPTECMALWEAALTCGSCATVTCAHQTCIDQGQSRVCIDEPESINGCDQESIAWRTCGGSCLQRPSSWNEGGGSSTGGSFSRAVVTSRCACPGTLEPGGAAGAACTSDTDCAQICCACATGHGRYLVRTCQSGRCLGEPEICADANATGSSLASFCQG
jgi:hypothetical protein